MNRRHFLKKSTGLLLMSTSAPLFAWAQHIPNALWRRRSLDIEFVSNYHQSATQSVWTFTNVALGDVHANRYILIGVAKTAGSGNTSIQGVTLNGVPATELAVATSGGTSRAGWFLIKQPAGTTGTITVTVNANRCGIVIYRTSTTPSFTIYDSKMSDGSNPWMTTINVPFGGAVLGIGFFNEGGAVATTTRYSSALALVSAGKASLGVGTQVGTNNVGWTTLIEKSDVAFINTSLIDNNVVMIIALKPG